jgi:hypothetical protein
LVLPSTQLGSDGFPREIPPGDRFSAFAEAATFCAGGPPSGRQWHDYDRVYFEDALGKYHLAKPGKRFYEQLLDTCASLAD